MEIVTRSQTKNTFPLLAVILAVVGFCGTHTIAQTLPQAAFSQVTGVVVDSASGQPIPLASLSLLNKKNTLLVRGTGSESGSFVFSQVPPDTYSLTIAGAGYQSRTLSKVTVQTVGLSIPLDTIRIRPTHLGTNQSQVAFRRVKGVVIDSASGRPLPLMAMTLINKRRTSIMRESGSDAGFFLFAQVPPDTYTLTITGLGYQTRIIPGIRVNATDRTVQLDSIRLKSTALPARQPLSLSPKPTRYPKLIPASTQTLVSKQP